MKKLTQYVNPFQGNGEINPPNGHPLSRTWFFVKAQCANTFPHAALPFSKMTVGAYSGAYPTGYGTHMGNYCGKVPKMYDKKMMCGFSHLHHSGTGAVGFYYNYALTAPFFGDVKNAFDMMPIEGEEAHPGYYKATKACEDPIVCEATVTANGSALHRYRFARQNGKIAMDFGNDGLLCEEKMRAYSTFAGVKICGDMVLARVTLQGIMLYFAVKCKGAKSVCLFEDEKSVGGVAADYPHGHKGRFGVVFEMGDTTEAEVTVSYSTASEQKAALLCAADGVADFDESVSVADGIWEKHLGAIEIEATDDEAGEREKEIFYSNLYHSIIKPANLRGESFIYEDADGKEPFVTDFTTLWDIYKTQLPLVFALYADVAGDICHSLVKTCKALGHSPNCLTLSERFNTESNQARAITTIVLMTAHFFGVDAVERSELLEAMLEDIYNERNRDFLESGRCELYTHILDLSDACHSASLLAREIGDDKNADILERLAGCFVNAYDEKTGLLSDKSKYYEGGLHNYSFRLCHDHEKRAELAGGKERYAKLLCDFFGYGKECVCQPVEDDPEYVAKGIALGRFEGFNNEPDMETPYAFIYAGRHDLACEVIATGIENMFDAGEGGIPGNNDSGALSSCYVWNTMGVFPQAGSDKILIGTPRFRQSVIHTSSGEKFEIKKNGEGIYVKSAKLCGRKLENMWFKASEFINGGTLELEMSEAPAK